jgi:uncharacterized protein (TIRG00374 family)
MSIKKLLPIIGIIILIAILSQMDTHKILTVFSMVNPWYALLSLCSVVPLVLFANFEWQLILKKHKIYVSFWYSLKNIFIGYFYGFITPGGFGSYTRALYLKDESGEPLPKCFVNILMFNTVDYIALLSLGVIGGFVLSSRLPTVFPLILLVFIIMITLSIVFIRKKTGKHILKKLVQSRFFNPTKDKWHAHIDALYEDLPTFTDLILPFSISILGWLIWFSEVYVISFLFAIQVPYLYFMVIIAVANVIASIPITIYGLGTREMALIGLFSLFSIAPENVISLSLFWFIIIWLFPSIIGAGVTLLESRKKPVTMKPTTT